MVDKLLKLPLLLNETRQRFMAIFFEGSRAILRIASKTQACSDRADFGAEMVHRSHAHHEEHACHADYHNKKRHHRPEEHPWRNPIAAPRHRTAPCFSKKTKYNAMGGGRIDTSQRESRVAMK